MAKTNKYSSINFNHIYEKSHPSSQTNNPAKNPPSSSFSSASFSAISSPNKTHGRMLVLSRPSPKPISNQSPAPATTQVVADQAPVDAAPPVISLRPLGKTGGSSTAPSPLLGLEREKEVTQAVISPKPEKFVPPHLRPGFVGKEEKLGPEVVRLRESGFKQSGNLGSPGRYGDNGRPKSGSGHDKMRRAGDSDQGLMMNRPWSGGNRPNSSGCWIGIQEGSHGDPIEGECHFKETSSIIIEEFSDILVRGSHNPSPIKLYHSLCRFVFLLCPAGKIRKRGAYGM